MYEAVLVRLRRLALADEDGRFLEGAMRHARSGDISSLPELDLEESSPLR